MKLIPRNQRSCSYSICICNNDELWHEPIYVIGDKWKLYGSMQHYVYTIEIVGKRDLVVSYVDDIGVKRYSTFKIGSGGYANNGTPELRIKL